MSGLPLSLPRTVLITGATGGLGSALATEYAAPGRTLVLLGRDAERLELLAERCRALGAVVVSNALDLRDCAALRGWLQTFDGTPAIDLAIINAGLTSNIGPEQDGEDWPTVDALLDVNLRAALAAVDVLINAWRPRGSGQLALISSLSAYIGLPLTPAYCATKAGLKAYGEALRGWLSPRGIRVSVVLPGFVETPMSDRFPGPKPFMMSAERAARIIRAGLDRGSARISFPRALAAGMWCLSVLPPDLSQWILRRLGYGGRAVDRSSAAAG